MVNLRPDSRISPELTECFALYAIVSTIDRLLTRVRVLDVNSTHQPEGLHLVNLFRIRIIGIDNASITTSRYSAVLLELLEDRPTLIPVDLVAGCTVSEEEGFDSFRTVGTHHELTVPYDGPNEQRMAYRRMFRLSRMISSFLPTIIQRDGQA